MSGSKVEGYEMEGAEISNVVVGQVLAMERHPDSDHLWVCKVDVGGEAPIQIITGAQNVHVGDYVPAALDNSTLPGGVKIKKGKLRGLESNGMLCSLGELGLTTLMTSPMPYEDGIFILAGTRKRLLLWATDSTCQAHRAWTTQSVEFEITPNRPDCLSVTGSGPGSRCNLLLINRCRLHQPEVKELRGMTLSISYLERPKVENPELCPRYMARSGEE